MSPKFIIIKIQSRNFYRLLIRKLTEYQRIHFFAKKINGIYTIVIKCESFYNKVLKKQKYNNIYQSYIYLYTNLSIILSELIIDFYELRITHQILSSQHKDLSPYSMSRLKNILQIVLDSNFPSSESKKLYLYRKDLILTKLLMNFRNCNYIYPEHFVYFKLDNYLEHLENIVEKTCAKY
ncbi:MAG: hypothetical protein IJX99_05035 [Clostridia bacterium]|nr:hypothetical protein [Clostridia bacterium]